ncbi:MAG: hypothetical protein ACREP6_10835 [Candidatus Binataceae bacterium]
MAASIIGLVLLAITLGGCRSGKLPDESSYAAQLYAKRCGQCHMPYNPHSMTAKMWQTQVPIMEGKMAAAGMNPLTPAERTTIVNYLTRYAGNE